jgi:hypothetical protein
MPGETIRASSKICSTSVSSDSLFLVFRHREPKPAYRSALRLPPLWRRSTGTGLHRHMPSHLRHDALLPFAPHAFDRCIDTPSAACTARAAKGRGRGKKTHPLNRSCCDTACPGWHNFHRVPRVLRNRNVVVSPHFRDRIQAQGSVQAGGGQRSRSIDGVKQDLECVPFVSYPIRWPSQ